MSYRDDHDAAIARADAAERRAADLEDQVRALADEVASLSSGKEPPTRRPSSRPCQNLRTGTRAKRAAPHAWTRAHRRWVTLDGSATGSFAAACDRSQNALVIPAVES